MNMMTTTALNTSVVPDISSSFLGINLNIGDYRTKKLDSRITKQINDQHGVNSPKAKEVTGLYKDLMGHCEELTTIHTHVSATRRYYTGATLPLGNERTRICSNPRYFGSNQMDGVWNTLQAMQSDFYKFKSILMPMYEHMRDVEAPKVFGDLYNRADYLSLEDMDKRLYFTLETVRIPPMSHPMQGVEKERQEVIDELIAKQNVEVFKEMKRDMFMRLITPLQNMSLRLDYSENDKGEQVKNGFKDTLVTNVYSILDLIKHDNFDDDPILKDAVKKMEYALQGVTPDGLRHDEVLRSNTKRQVDDVLSTLPTLGF